MIITEILLTEPIQTILSSCCLQTVMMQGKAQSLFSQNINNFGNANHTLSIPIEIVIAVTYSCSKNFDCLFQLGPLIPL
jgi:hypothetical protein